MAAGNRSPLGSRCVCALSGCVAHRVPCCMSALPVICVVNGAHGERFAEGGIAGRRKARGPWFIRASCGSWQVLVAEVAQPCESAVRPGTG
jgi:hypothetical protein